MYRRQTFEGLPKEKSKKLALLFNVVLEQKNKLFYISGLSHTYPKQVQNESSVTHIRFAHRLKRIEKVLIIKRAQITLQKLIGNSSIISFCLLLYFLF